MLERTLCIRTALRAVHGSYSTQIELMRHVQSDCAQSMHDSCSDATAEVGSGPAEYLVSTLHGNVKQKCLTARRSSHVEITKLRAMVDLSISEIITTKRMPSYNAFAG